MTDILLNSEMDIEFAGEDFSFGESTLQHQQLLMLSNKGDWKESPTVGVDVMECLKDENEAGLLAAVKSEFEKDGMQVFTLQMDGEKLNVNAKYKN